ncbi:ABC transporter substrate-binding protein [Cellulomonas triticagri]|uniref:ABC transporter substrate-binding protein n=1 Tax=Cellulomonas triticagri TaxID=2483352 RepID=A0A3M2JBX6_9CELL|nr:ABC transporter substrate-binding protein [Cellulomonas triticagri]RMI09330.1 ABC transporter substrate-binding protein [Cellulomonas triticagri]
MLRRTATALLAVPLVLVGCAPAATGPDAEVPVAPVTVTNCGQDVVFPSVPERVVLLESAPVTVLDALGVLDRVVARAGTFPDVYYDDALNERLAAIPMLSEDIDASGHLMLSSEVVVAQRPDLVLGLPDGVTREGLADVGARALVQPTYCGEGVGPTTFDSLYDQLRTYGEVFERQEEAATAVDALAARVHAVESAGVGQDRTAAVLYPSVGGGALYAYGTASMAHPQLAAAGFANVFGDVPERVFEVGVEDLIARDPDVLVLLTQVDDETGVLDEVRTLPGAEALSALRTGSTLVQWFNFTEPPSPLVVDGLERIVARFGADAS